MELSLFSEKTVETPYATFPEESELCEAWFAGNDCTLIKITYHGFCGTCATQAGEAGRTYRQAAENLSDTHSCSLNKGIGWESRTRNEAASAVKRQRGRLPKVAVFLKCCFPCRTHPVCGENRSFEELSWLREKAEAMRLRKGENPLRMNG